MSVYNRKYIKLFESFASETVRDIANAKNSELFTNDLKTLRSKFKNIKLSDVTDDDIDVMSVSEFLREQVYNHVDSSYVFCFMKKGKLLYIMDDNKFNSNPIHLDELGHINAKTKNYPDIIVVFDIVKLAEKYPKDTKYDKPYKNFNGDSSYDYYMSLYSKKAMSEKLSDKNKPYYITYSDNTEAILKKLKYHISKLNKYNIYAFLSSNNIFNSFTFNHRNKQLRFIGNERESELFFRKINNMTHIFNMSEFIKMNRKDIQKELDKETPLDLDKVLIGLDSIYNYGQKIVEKFKSIETVEDFLKIQKHGNDNSV